jgi:hypothetical protein
MRTVYYLSAFIPPEWVAAHGMRPRRLLPRACRGVGRPGVCPFVTALLTELEELEGELVVLTTTCDQMRRGAELAACSHGASRSGVSPVFLFNMPATWHEAARKQYQQELMRLSRFLLRHGGHLTEGLAGEAANPATSASHNENWPGHSQTVGVPVAVVGGHLLADHRSLYSEIERLGGAIAVNGSEMGGRWPAAVAGAVSVEALTAAYFDAIPDVFRRPDTRLAAWLTTRTRGVRGVIFLSYTWCDLWRAAQHQLAEAAGLPALFLELGSEPVLLARTSTRIEAFLEAIA